jgi:hypothetical protein
LFQILLTDFEPAITAEACDCFSLWVELRISRTIPFHIHTAGTIIEKELNRPSLFALYNANPSGKHTGLHRAWRLSSRKQSDSQRDDTFIYSFTHSDQLNLLFFSPKHNNVPLCSLCRHLCACLPSIIWVSFYRKWMSESFFLSWYVCTI